MTKFAAHIVVASVTTNSGVAVKSITRVAILITLIIGELLICSNSKNERRRHKRSVMLMTKKAVLIQLGKQKESEAKQRLMPKESTGQSKLLKKSKIAK